MSTPPDRAGLRPPRRAAARAALFFGALLLLLVPLELVARSRYAPRYDRLDASTSPPEAAAGRPGASLALLDLVQPSAWPDLVYELRPSLEASFQGAPYRSNTLGMRDDEIVSPKPPGTLRVAFLGDSFTFGWGVPAGLAYPELLEGLLAERLAARGDGRRVEVLNFGVPGYNSAMEAACLEHKALPLEPDLVVVQYFYNDAYLPNFVMPPRPRPASYLVEWIRDLLGLRRPPGAGLAAPGPEGESAVADWRADPARVPPGLAHTVGAAGVERALARMKALAGAAGIPLALFLVSQPGPRLVADASLPAVDLAPDREAAAACERLGIPVIRTLEPTVRHLRAAGRTMEGLILSSADWHPNAEGHRLYAELLAEGLDPLLPAP